MCNNIFFSDFSRKIETPKLRLSDHIWLEYILTLDRLEGGSKGLPSVTTLDCGEEETLRPEALLWSSASEGRCPVPLGWEPMPGLPEELHARLQVHRRVGGLVCGERR